MGFRENVRALRERLGLTQVEMAQKAGVPFRSYQNWEMGSREPRIQVLATLAEALGVTVDELLRQSSTSPTRGPGRPPKATPAPPPAEDLIETRKAKRGADATARPVGRAGRPRKAKGE